MCQNCERVEGLKVFNQSIVNRHSAIFFNERAKHAIPDNQRTGKIGIQIFRITAMVDAVVAWRVKNKFEPARHAVNRFGVQKELVSRIENAAKYNQYRVKSDQDQRNFEHHRAGKMLHPALPQRYGHVEIGR